MKPVVLVVSDTSMQGPHLFHQVGDKYVTALRRCAGVTPLMVPSFETPIEFDDLLACADGILFTGGYSNIERHHYGAEPAPDGELQDPLRDKNTLSFITSVLKANLPMLGICRGLQELNVALGGTLYPRVHEVEGRFDHREDKESPIDLQYGPAHSVDLMPDGVLDRIVESQSFEVNSVHGQAIDKLAPGLVCEATAPDGTIEAVSVEGSNSFALAVQWHPEWKAWENPQSTKIFEAFGQAAQQYNSNKTQ